MSFEVQYIIASTARSAVVDARVSLWTPAGQTHAFCVGVRGRRPTVTMCGVDIASLHLFEGRRFLEPRTGHECRDCRDWVLATSTSIDHTAGRSTPANRLPNRSDAAAIR